MRDTFARRVFRFAGSYELVERPKYFLGRSGATSLISEAM